MLRIMTLILFTFSLNLQAKECEAVEWPYAKKQTTREFHALFKLNSFDANMSYLLNELGKDKRSELEKLLFKYLIFNSADKNITGFLKAMEWARVEKDGKIKKISRKDFCGLYEKSLALD